MKKVIKAAAFDPAIDKDTLPKRNRYTAYAKKDTQTREVLKDMKSLFDKLDSLPEAFLAQNDLGDVYYSLIDAIPTLSRNVDDGVAADF